MRPFVSGSGISKSCALPLRLSGSKQYMMAEKRTHADLPDEEDLSSLKRFRLDDSGESVERKGTEGTFYSFHLDMLRALYSSQNNAEQEELNDSTWKAMKEYLEERVALMTYKSECNKWEIIHREAISAAERSSRSLDRRPTTTSMPPMGVSPFAAQTPMSGSRLVGSASAAAACTNSFAIIAHLLGQRKHVVMDQYAGKLKRYEQLLKSVETRIERYHSMATEMQQQKELRISNNNEKEQEQLHSLRTKMQIWAYFARDLQAVIL